MFFKIVCFTYVHIYRERGYYMAARRYEISLRLLTYILRVSADNERNIFFQHEKRNFVSPSEHVKFYLLYKHQWNTKPFYSKQFFGVKGAIYYVAIATVIFSQVNMSSFRVKAHLVFHLCLYNKYIYQKNPLRFISIWLEYLYPKLRQRNKKNGLSFIRLYFYCRDLPFMAVTNFTQGKNQATIQELYCSAEFTREVHSDLICLSALNIFLSVTAFLGNTLILVALHKETSLHLPSKLLYRNLAITDLCVGIIAEPLKVAYWMSVVTGRWNICYYAHLPVTISGTGLCAVSLQILTAISVDRLLALLLGLRYRQVVTFRRTCIILLGMWISSILGTSSFLWDPVIYRWYIYLGISLSFLVLICSYTKILSIFLHNQIQVHNHVVQGQPSQSIPALNIARYRKAVYNALWVQGTLVGCYHRTKCKV